MRRLLIVVALLVALTGASLVGAASPAHADAKGCTFYGGRTAGGCVNGGALLTPLPPDPVTLRRR